MTRTSEERERARREREARRAAREAREQPAKAPPADPPPPTAAPAEPEAPRRRRRLPRPPLPSRRLAIALAVVAVVAGWFLLALFQPLKGDGEGRVRVEIPRGASVGEIARALDERGVVSSSLLFQVRATLARRRGDLKPGIYTLRRDMSYAAAIDALAAGPPQHLIQVTIPEGGARSEVAPLVEGKGVRGDYLRASKRSRLLDPADYGGDSARSLEGFLFPDTYELRRGDPARRLVERQLEAFERELAKAGLGAGERRRLGGRRLSVYEVLTVASMVERETAVARERPIVASVIYNRLRREMPLAIDATVRFATGNWRRPLTRSELAIDSPYNTRERAGLPPGPIGSPGLASIGAAARPARSGYLFYVVKPGTCGEHAFSRTSEQFERDVDRYEAARRERGGRSPVDC